MRYRILLSGVVLTVICVVGRPTLAAAPARCVQVTWFQGATENTIKGLIYPDESRLIYDLKNGVMEFMWTLPEGIKSGDPNGFEGTWQQDDGKGTFTLKEDRKTAIFEGTWTKRGNQRKNKLRVEYCKN